MAVSLKLMIEISCMSMSLANQSASSPCTAAAMTAEFQMDHMDPKKEEAFVKTGRQGEFEARPVKLKAVKLRSN